MTKSYRAGFTLLEIIITITLIAIVGAIMFSAFGTSMIKSSEPISRMQTSLTIQRSMEDFVSAFEMYYGGDLQSFKNDIASGALKPEGEYTIIENKFIKYVSDNEEPGDGTEQYPLLKVTIENTNGETLTYVFAGV